MPKQQWQPIGEGETIAMHPVSHTTITIDKVGIVNIDRGNGFRSNLMFPDNVRVCQLVNVDVDTPQPMPDDVMKAAHQMLDALKMAYRKHHLEDTAVGWNELSRVMQDALCEAMGDESFIAWLDGLAKE